MAEKETKNSPKDLVEAVPEEIAKLDKEIISDSEEVVPLKEEDLKKLDREEKTQDSIASWAPKTRLGKLVKEGKEKDIDKILKTGKKILESEIVDKLLSLETDLILIGQAKGKFGGGKRRAWRQTQKKTKEGNVLSFSAMAVVGDNNGHVGVGFGRASETLPAREKAVRNAKLGIMKVELGHESPEEELDKSKPHTIPFKIEGKCGSVRVTFWPAPRGTGLVAGDEIKKILSLAGIKDAYTRAVGHTKTTFNVAKACIDALSKTTVEMA
ncbi:MAG: 30S ribosomal protein S5 [Nanoarchaeota archaeon]|nr:30S ribosomal protein S5 [Nanoarchaeota archaeon]MBU0977798.1 30S ribosomal protein S5 [Nanoarchaeota archaeon]